MNPPLNPPLNPTSVLYLKSFGPSDFQVEAELKWVPELGQETLKLYFKVSGPVHKIVLKPLPNFENKMAQEKFYSQPFHELWKHTCLECFIGPSGRKNYVEFNGSPYGAWALYSFEQERKRRGHQDGVWIPDLVPKLEVFIRTEKTWEFVFHLGLFNEWKKHLEIDNADPNHNSGKIDVQLSAVLEIQGQASVEYFALKHLKNSPDFHDRLSWNHEVRY